MITIENLTKSYGIDKGVFNLTFTVNKGEIFGFIGPNGAGKTTTIRHLLGFIHPDEGKCSIMGMDTISFAPKIQESLGYLPGEIAFFDHMTGLEFLRLLLSMRNIKDETRMHELILMLELDTSAKIRKMSKGMKQKLGLVAAFMHNPEILILDEPTSGLDPLMQNKFIKLILEEKKRGKTILMSSHSFEEIERTCDRAGIIKNGRLVALENIKTLKENQRKIYIIHFHNLSDIESLQEKGFDIVNQQEKMVEIAISGDVNPLLKALSDYDILSLDVKHLSLEEVFMKYYIRGESNE
ncbi:MAG: ABC transporter ATP-binding protein [Firmicutes bacterium]|nr:ABC transporter ATP-binding protein [Bacillota bacterium]